MAKRNLPNGAAIPMEPGERDRAVKIEKLTTSKGPSGAPVETWTTLVDPYWVRKMQVRQSERFQALQTTAPPDTQWEGGYRSDMDPDLLNVVKLRRIVYQGWIYEIVAADQI